MTADQAATAWGDLAHWIAEVLVPWYQITRDELPNCWAMHRPAVVELSWLRSAHIEAFASNTAAHHADHSSSHSATSSFVAVNQTCNSRLGVRPPIAHLSLSEPGRSWWSDTGLRPSAMDAAQPTSLV
jgi:hypothetical protein